MVITYSRNITYSDYKGINELKADINSIIERLSTIESILSKNKIVYWNENNALIYWNKDNEIVQWNTYKKEITNEDNNSTTTSGVIYWSEF